MTDTATDYNTLLQLLPDVSDDINVTVGWISPGDVRSIVKSMAVQYVLNNGLPETTGTMPPGANQPLTPGGASNTSPGFGGTITGDEFAKVAAGVPNRTGTITLNGRITTLPTAPGVLNVKVGGVIWLTVPVGGTGQKGFAGASTGVTFAAGAAITVESDGLDACVLSTFRLGITAGSPALS